MINLKKGAMFGLESRALKKKSGRLFLESFRKLTFRLVEGHQAILRQTSKGAMFGLDARIALAIFGALSIIAGAALYSAIQNARATAMITELKEIGKAWESYYLDTGLNLPQVSSDSSTDDFYRIESLNLIEDPSVNGWQGPYLPYKKSFSFVEHPTNGYIYLWLLSSDIDWSDWTDGKCTSGRACSVWVGMNKMSGTEMAKKIDEIIDESDGVNKGDFRWASSGGGYYVYIIKAAPIQNPND